MWSLDPRPGLAGHLAVLAYAAAVIGFLLLQEVGLRLRREEHQAWWAGPGRDLLNVAGLLAIGGALRLVGLSAPAALLVGGTVTLLLFGASTFVATQTDWRHPRAWAIALGAALAAPPALFPREVVSAVASVAHAFFGVGR